MWKDSETELDFLDFDYLIAILKDTINDKKLLPSSIGVYGDWGSGKSSLMQLCKKELETEDANTVCLVFNGWLYESYDDAKIAMIGAILDGIKDKRTLIGESLVLLNSLYNNVNKFKLAKNAAKYGVDFFLTGGIGTIADLTIKSITNKLKNGANESSELVDKIKSDLDYDDIREDIREFRSQFGKLLEKAGIDKLVIFVDELDRCSPNTILDTLEAMRLFLFVGNVSFVIGADERHIAYAIKTKFNEISGINMDIGKEYQEKMIQYPIRIPTLNNLEMEFYILCLLAQNHLSNEEFITLIKELKLAKKNDFLNFELSYPVVQKICPNCVEKIKDDILIAKQLSPILSKGLNGNPRQCKRFLNSLDMREKMAKYRGVSLDTRVLAKIMQIEYFRPSLFKTIGNFLGDGELIEEIKMFEENQLENLVELAVFKDDEWVCNLMSSEPVLSNINLPEYFYFMRTSLENKFSISSSKLSDNANKICQSLLHHSEIALNNVKNDVKKCTESERELILTYLYEDLTKDDKIDNIKIKFFLGWGSSNTRLETSAIEQLSGINGEKIGLSTIPLISMFYNNVNDKEKLDKLLEKWTRENTRIAKNLIKIIRGE